MTKQITHRTLVANVVLMLASVAVGAAALEVGLRIADGFSLWPGDNLILARADRFTRRGDQAYDPRLGWLTRPNLSAVRTQSEPALTTGELGVRMNQAAIRPVPRKAILTVGDSFTLGAEVADAATWPAALERLLGQAVVNGGVGGFGADQIVLRAETLIDELAPKAVIVSFLSGDIGRAQHSVFNGANKPYYLVENDRLVARNVPVPTPSGMPDAGLGMARRVLGHSYLVYWTMSRLGVRSWFEVAKFVKIANDPAQVACLLLARLQRTAAERDVRLIFVMQWPADEIISWEHRSHRAATVLGCAADAGIQVVDTWDTLKAAYAGNKARLQQLYNSQQNGAIFTHMSPAGNAVIAELIAKAVTDRQFVVAPPRITPTMAPSRNLPLFGPQAVVADLVVTRDAAAGAAGERTATLLDDQSARYGVIYQDIAVADDGLTHAVAIDLKYRSSPLSQVVIAYLGGKQVIYYAYVDGSSMATSGEGAITARPLGDGWYRVVLAGANNRSGNHTLRVHLYPRQGRADDRGAVLFDNARLDP